MDQPRLAPRAHDPAYGSGSFLMQVLRAADIDLDALRAELPDPEPAAEPSLSGMAWLEHEFERLQQLPFAASSAGSTMDPPVPAREAHLAMRLCSRPSPRYPVTGCHLPGQATITIDADPRATRAQASLCMLHELTHASATPQTRDGRRVLHGRTFSRTFATAVEEAYGIVLGPEDREHASFEGDLQIIRALEAMGGDEWSLLLGE